MCKLSMLFHPENLEVSIMALFLRKTEILQKPASNLTFILGGVGYCYEMNPSLSKTEGKLLKK